MRILLIHQAFAALGEPGGTRHHEFSRYFAQQGHAVTVVTGQLSYLTGAPTAAGGWSQTEIDDAGVRIVRCYSYRAYHRSFVHRALSFLTFMLSSTFVALRQGPQDVVWGTSPPLMQGLSAWVVAGLRRAPLLFEVRDLWPAFAVAVGVLRNPVLIALSQWLERFLYRRARIVVINSPGFEAHVTNGGARRVELVPNGVDVSMFRPGERGQAFRKAQGLVGRFVVMYAGAHGISNDLGTLLDAAEELRGYPDIVFVLVGDGKEKPRLIARAREAGLANVRFVQPLPKMDMAGALAAADACLAILKPLEAYRTTYPNKVFDYMAAGRPVILVIDGVIRQVLELAEAGVYVPPGDVEALAQAILALRRDPKLRRHMGAAGRVCAEQAFDRRQSGALMLRLMEAEARGAPRRGSL